jgi:hypothetical protein
MARPFPIICLKSCIYFLLSVFSSLNLSKALLPLIISAIQELFG